MIQFTLAEILGFALVFLGCVFIQFTIWKRKVKKLTNELKWERNQMSMVLAEVQNFKRISEELRKNSQELAIKMAVKESATIEEEEFMEDIENDMIQGKLSMN